jgi:hypothetical protein
VNQSRTTSLKESVSNTALGFGISLFAQWLALPLLGVTVTLAQNFQFAVIMTFVSVARGYVIRRWFESKRLSVPLSPGALAVMAERRRQIDVEGWTAEHDAAHSIGEMARAGAAYAVFAKSHAVDSKSSGSFSTAIAIWPWSKEWWKPQDFRRDLVRAAALILAEIDRFDGSRRRRATPAEGQS